MPAMSDFQPCPDELCVGVIGEDGTCTICGALSATLIPSADLDGRLPCRDGNCIGVAGPDGHCTECGAYIGDPEEEETMDIDDDDRRPCPDRACLGVIGDDGRCTECGEAIEDSGFDDGHDDDEWIADTYGETEEIDENDERRPCPDGACIGILDEEGVCSDCGRHVDEITRSR